MTNEELVALVKQGHGEYIEQLYTQNLPLIRRFIAPYVPDGQEMEDCLQEAFFGLSNAVQRYDADAGVLFMTFAKWHIVRAVQDYLYSNSLIRLPQYLHEKSQKCRKAAAAIFQEGKMPTRERVSSLTGISATEQDMLASFMRGCESLDAEIETAEGDTVPLYKSIPSGEDVEEDAVNSLYKEKMRSDLWGAVYGSLSVREGYIVIKSELCNESLRQIAEACGISQERVRQVKKDAFRHLRKRCGRLLESYAETEGLPYKGGCKLFRQRQESCVERASLRHLELEEDYRKMLQDERQYFKERMRKDA